MGLHGVAGSIGLTVDLLSNLLALGLKEVRKTTQKGGYCASRAKKRTNRESWTKKEIKSTRKLKEHLSSKQKRRQKKEVSSKRESNGECGDVTSLKTFQIQGTQMVSTRRKRRGGRRVRKSLYLSILLSELLGLLLGRVLLVLESSLEVLEGVLDKRHCKVSSV